MLNSAARAVADVWRSALEGSRVDVFKHQVETILRDWKKEEDFRPVYANSFDSDDKIFSYWKYYQRSLARMVPRFRGSVGFDLGCWLGFSVLAMRSLGAKQVYGVDPLPEYIRTAEAWRLRYNLPGVQFMILEDCTAVTDESADWVTINQVLCNALPESSGDTLALSYRLLRKGGVLVLADSNNPYCPETLERLEKRYRHLEIGSGSPQQPSGTVYAQRRAMIREIDETLSDEIIDEIARRTCYLWGQEIFDATDKFIKEGVLPESLFESGVERPPCVPSTGLALGNVTDPYDISNELEQLGFSAHIVTTPSWEPLGKDELCEALKTSQGFYVYARKA